MLSENISPTTVFQLRCHRKSEMQGEIRPSIYQGSYHRKQDQRIEHDYTRFLPRSFDKSKWNEAMLSSIKFDQEFHHYSVLFTEGTNTISFKHHRKSRTHMYEYTQCSIMHIVRNNWSKWSDFIRMKQRLQSQLY